MSLAPSASKLALSRLASGTALAVSALLLAGGLAPASAAPLGVEELPPIRYVSQNFSDFTWTTDRRDPATFVPQANQLNVAVDRTTAHPSAYERVEGKQAALPLQVDAGAAGIPDMRNVVSVKSDIYIDPAWQGLPASTDRLGLERSFDFGMWLITPWHPNWPGYDAWPTIEIASNADGNPVATILDTLAKVDPEDSPEVPVAYGDTVSLEIRYNRADYSMYYFVDETLIFSHQWSNVDGAGFPFNGIIFQALNPGLPGEGSDLNPVAATWSNLQFGVLVPPATLVTELLPDGAADAQWGPATLTVESEVPAITSVVGGALPPGLTLDTAGVISGTPTTPGTFTFTVLADNGAPLDDTITSSRSYTITIEKAAVKPEPEQPEKPEPEQPAKPEPGPPALANSGSTVSGMIGLAGLGLLAAGVGAFALRRRNA